MLGDEDRSEIQRLLSGDDAEPCLYEVSGSHRPELSTLQLMLVSAALAGSQLGFGIQIGWSSGALEEFGMTSVWLSWIWLAGPISGIFIGILVGALSDRCRSRWGARKPFIFLGLVILLIGLLLFGFAGQIGRFGNDAPQCYLAASSATVEPGDCPVALTSAIVSFCLIDISANMLQIPARALLSDVAPTCQQEVGNAWFSFMASFGSVLAMLLGSLRLTQLLPHLGSQVQALYILGSVLVFIAVSCTLWGAPSNSTATELQDTPAQTSVMSTLVSDARNLPTTVKNVFLVNFLSYYSFFCVFMYATAWMGRDVLNGDPDGNIREKDLFNRGIRLGNIGMMLQYCLAMLLTVQFTVNGYNFRGIIPVMVERFSVKRVYFIAQLTQAICMALTIVVVHLDSEVLAVSALALLGVAWGVSLSLPWAVIGRYSEGLENKGTMMALYNLSCCTPEIVASVVSFFIMYFVHSSTWVLGTGALSSLVSTFVLIVYRVEENEYDESMKDCLS